MRNALYGILIACGFAATLLLLSSNLASPGEDSATLLAKDTFDADDKQLPQLVKSPKLKSAYAFAGESLDMDNFDVRERLEREFLRNSYFHSNTLLIIKRTARYFPLIERILAEEGLPDDLKYIAVTESDLLNVVSPAGARGLWQFMPSVGRSFGLEINDEVEERYHVEKATRAAAQHLRNYKDQFGSWQFAVAAYNMGEGNMRKYLREQQAERYEDLNVNDETMRYLFRLVAMKNIIETPRAFGFYLDKNDFYPPLDNYRSIEVTESIPDLSDFAKEQGISYRQLKLYNPWLINGKLTVSKKTYEIRVPN
ncbi:murein transglycosylase [Lewinellaceae bacterium SD302]|nr:murein transglycosylase [Lewinellaceae bacterium SD302]